MFPTTGTLSELHRHELIADGHTHRRVAGLRSAGRRRDGHRRYDWSLRLVPRARPVRTVGGPAEC